MKLSNLKGKVLSRRDLGHWPIPASAAFALAMICSAECQAQWRGSHGAVISLSVRPVRGGWSQHSQKPGPRAPPQCGCLVLAFFARAGTMPRASGLSSRFPFLRVFAKASADVSEFDSQCSRPIRLSFPPLPTAQGWGTLNRSRLSQTEKVGDRGRPHRACRWPH